MSESQRGVAGDRGLDATKSSLGLQHRDISEMFSLLLPHSMKKKFPGWGVCLCLCNPLPQCLTDCWDEPTAEKSNDNND